MALVKGSRGEVELFSQRIYTAPRQFQLKHSSLQYNVTARYDCVVKYIHDKYRYRDIHMILCNPA